MYKVCPKTCTWIFIAPLFIPTQNQKQYKCFLVSQQIKNKHDGKDPYIGVHC